MAWEPISWPALPEQPPLQPTTAGIIYPGARHIFSGPPEAAKTWAAFAIALEEIRAGGVALHLDFEMNAWQTRERLRLMGATPEDFDRFLYVAPEAMASDDVIGELVTRERITIASIDALAGAYRLQGLEDNGRTDAEHFYATMVSPFWRRGVSTLLLDHVVKNQEARGQFTIGSERKVGAADVHLGFDPIVPFGRGRIGRFKITTHKDRFGCLPRPRAAELELRSDQITNAVTWTFEPAKDNGEDWRPTILMEKVSRFLEHQPDPVSRNTVEKSVGGQAKALRAAIEHLIADGHVAQEPGTRNALLLKLIRPFSTSSRPWDEVTETSNGNGHHFVPAKTAQQSHTPTSSHLVPTSSERSHSSSSLVPPPIGGTRSNEDEVTHTQTVLLGHPDTNGSPNP